MIKKLKQLFCKHAYTIMPEFDDEEERNKIIMNLKKGESIAFSRRHKCPKCDKERMIGSGIIC